MAHSLSEWQRCRPWIKAALKYGTDTHTIEDIDAAIERHEMALIAGERSVLVCEVVAYPQLKEFNIFAAGGDLKEIKGFAKRVRAAALAMGCSRITMRTKRNGWLRALKDFGISDMQIILAKDL